MCCRVLPCVAAECGRDHHHNDLTLQQRAAMCFSVVPRVTARVMCVRVCVCVCGSQ